MWNSDHQGPCSDHGQQSCIRVRVSVSDVIHTDQPANCGTKSRVPSPQVPYRREGTEARKL